LSWLIDICLSAKISNVYNIFSKGITRIIFLTVLVYKAISELSGIEFFFKVPQHNLYKLPTKYYYKIKQPISAFLTFSKNTTNTSL